MREGGRLLIFKKESHPHGLIKTPTFINIGKTECHAWKVRSWLLYGVCEQKGKEFENNLFANLFD